MVACSDMKPTLFWDQYKHFCPQAFFNSFTEIWFTCYRIFTYIIIYLSLCNYHHYLILECFYHSRRSPISTSGCCLLPLFFSIWQSLIFLSLYTWLFWTFHIIFSWGACEKLAYLFSRRLRIILIPRWYGVHGTFLKLLYWNWWSSILETVVSGSL